jgi:hypothetical protein
MFSSDNVQAAIKRVQKLGAVEPLAEHPLAQKLGFTRSAVRAWLDENNTAVAKNAKLIGKLAELLELTAEDFTRSHEDFVRQLSWTIRKDDVNGRLLRTLLPVPINDEPTEGPVASLDYRGLSSQTG